MNITIIGASAGVGLEAVKRALERNHFVTTLSRSTINLPDNPRLKKLIGSATQKEDILLSIKNADAIIVAIGTGTSMKPTTLYSDFAKLIVEALTENNLSIPVIVLTGFGAGDSWNYQPNLLMKLFFKFLLKDVYADKTKMEEIISHSELNWTIVRPGLLKDKPLTERYKIENQLFKGIKINSINRADVADFMIKEAENPKYKHQFVSLSNQ